MDDLLGNSTRQPWEQVGPTIIREARLAVLTRNLDEEAHNELREGDVEAM